jgi:hypothetical protein
MPDSHNPQQNHLLAALSAAELRFIALERPLSGDRNVAEGSSLCENALLDRGIR